MRDRLLQKSSFFSPRLVALTLGCFSVVSNDAIQAQIVPDNTVGSHVERVNATRDRITGGTTRGSNLFHSFREFSIQKGRAAYFANPAAIRTIFSRVTGNNPSQIFGTLGVEGSANLFFINPNGIIFGPNATLDVRGSFIASTANSIAFPNGQEFSATNPNAPPLLTIDVPVPIGLVFESDNSGIILNAANLETRQNLALIGAGIRSSGSISAPGQNITLATVPAGIDSVVRLEGTGQYIGQTTQGTGQPNVAGRDIVLKGGKLNAYSFEINGGGNILLNSAGDILLSDEAVIDVEGAGGGSITVNAQNLEINRSDILAGIASGLGSPNAQAGDININATESVKLQGGDSQFYTSIRNLVNSGDLGNAGNININTGTLEGSGAFQISFSTFGRGNAGRVNIKAEDAVSLNGVEDFLSGIFSSVQESGNGNGGRIEIKTGSLSLSNGAVLFTSTLNRGNAGNIQIKATESVSLNGSAYLEADTYGTGNAGNITIEVEKGTVSFEGINTRASTFVRESATGEGGNLNLTADTVSLSNEAFLRTGTSGKKNAGNLNIATRQLLVRDGAVISTFAGEASEGNAGKLSINARESVQLIGASADGINSSLRTRTFGKGSAGDLNIETRQLLVRDGAFISTEAVEGSGGNAGKLSINARESVQLIGASADGNSSRMFADASGKGNAGNVNIVTRQLLLQDGASISANNYSQGNAGNINLNVGQLLLQDSSVISMIADGTGNAGNLTVRATESVKLIGTDADTKFSNILNTDSQGKGNAGDVTITTRQLLLQDGARISTRTLGDGKGGTLTIDASESIRLSGVRASDSSPTRITSQAQGAGDAGILNISTKNLLVEDGAAIIVNSRGRGLGGEIFLNTDSLTLDDGTISAETTSTDGGNLFLNVSDLLLLRNGSQITTTAGTERAGGNGGIIRINAVSIVAVPQENSDITANAFAGDGGQVLINTQSIFGIDFRSQLTPLSDITASSDLGAAGEVIINTSGVEPTQGVEALTEERINVEVSQGCRVGGTASGTISFYNVGRGGLPPSPDDLLNSPPTYEWLSLQSAENRISQPKVESSFSQQSNNPIASQLIFSCQVR